MNEIVALGQIQPARIPGSAMMVPPRLTRRAKAAIVVRLLLNEGADIPLEGLPDALQASLTQQMGAMRTIDRETLASVVEEFAHELDSIGLSFPGGIAGAITALDGKISKQTAERLRKEAGVREMGDPWDRLRGLDAAQLLPMVENESIEVAAVVLSKLKVGLAAELLGKLPGPKARQITYAVSLTSNVAPQAVERIGISLAGQLDNVKVKAFETGPVERVGAILNSSTSLTRDDMLSGLEETDQGFATAVRKAIFTFANIPARVSPRDIPAILRLADQSQLVIALAGAEAAGMKNVQDFILENMSGRMADQLREDVADAGVVKPSDAEDAMSAFVTVIREMEADGNLQLIVEEDEEA
jgi:flagellar motor switch protein FliG